MEKIVNIMQHSLNNKRKIQNYACEGWKEKKRQQRKGKAPENTLILEGT